LALNFFASFFFQEKKEEGDGYRLYVDFLVVGDNTNNGGNLLKLYT
jgi:hypothetical protein